MSKKYIELQGERVAVLNYHFKVDQKTELFKELGEDEIIPAELYGEPIVQIKVINENGTGTIGTSLSKCDIDIIHQAISELKPERETVAAYYF